MEVGVTGGQVTVALLIVEIAVWCSVLEIE